MEINNLNYLQKFLGCSISNFETHYDLLKVAKAVNEIVSSIPNSRKRKHDGSFYIDALMRRDSTQITLDQFNIQEILNRVKVIPKGSYDQYDQDIAFLKKIHKSLFFLRDSEYFMSKVVKEDPLLLEFASERLQGTEQLVKKALEGDFLALQFASEEIKKNPRIILFAYLMSYDARVIDIAAQELQDDAEFMDVYDRFIFETFSEDSFIVNRVDLMNLHTEDPEEILEDFSEMITQHFVSIEYEDSEGRDMGGLTRDFITQLFNALHKLDRLGNKSATGMIYPRFQEEEIGVYRGIGKILGAILSYNYKDVVIGRHFDPPFFEMIHHMIVALLQENSTTFPNPTPELIEKMFALCGKNVLGIDEETFQDIIQNKSAVLEDTYDVANKQEFLDEYFRPYCLSAFYIVQGMRLFMRDFWWKRLPHMTPQEMEKEIQGSLSSSEILEVLDCTGVSSKTMRYLKRWIQDASCTNLEKFLEFTTGAPALRPDVRLTVKPQEDGRMPTSSTCANTLYLSECADYTTFEKYMDFALEHLVDGFQFL